MKITVLDGLTLNPGDNPWTAFEPLGELIVHDRTPPELIVERARGSEIVLTNKTPLTRETIAQLPELRYIGVLATGYDVVDAAAARARGIVVTNVPEYGTDAVAQHTFALLLSLIQAPERHDGAVRAGEWARVGDFSFWRSPVRELAGKMMGLVGYGRIGRRVGQIARAFGMQVIAHTPRRPARAIDPPHFDDGTPWLALDELFARSDVISLHCPQTPQNTSFVNRALLARMKSTAFLINTARGGLINEQYLADALAEGRVAGAGLDVVSSEPIDAGNPLLHAPNCLITPHMAWAALEARQRLMKIAAQNLQAFLEGKPRNVVG